MKTKLILGLGAVVAAGVMWYWQVRRPFDVAPDRREAAVTATPERIETWLHTERHFEPSETLRSLQTTYRNSGDVAQKTWTLAAAAKLGEPPAVLWLAELAATDPMMAPRALDALGRVSSLFVAPELGDLATSNGPVPIRTAAIRALGASGGDVQAVQLGALAADGKQPYRVRQQAAQIVGVIGKPMVVPALGAALEQAEPDTSHEGQELRIALVLALAHFRTPEARALLERHDKRPLAALERRFTEQALRSTP